jgi:hypothetical protein
VAKVCKDTTLPFSRDGDSQWALAEATPEQAGMSAIEGLPEIRSDLLNGSYCDGFRMPAHHDAIHAHHGPAFESRRGRKARGVGHPAQRALWRFGWRRWRSVGLVKQAGSAANER